MKSLNSYLTEGGLIRRGMKVRLTTNPALFHDISEEDLSGDIKDFPIEVVDLMLTRQEEYQGEADISVFQ